MDKWPYEVYYVNPKLVKPYCVDHTEWQKHRLAMKGKSTPEKLRMLLWWREEKIWEYPPHVVQTQVDNYINALKRGGQLDMDLKVQR